MSNRCQTRQYKHLELAMLNPHGCPPKKNSFLKQRHICHGQTTVAYCIRDSLATSEANFVVAPKPQTTIEIANKSFLISRYSRAYIKVDKKSFQPAIILEHRATPQRVDFSPHPIPPKYRTRANASASSRECFCYYPIIFSSPTTNKLKN